MAGLTAPELQSGAAVASGSLWVALYTWVEGHLTKIAQPIQGRDELVSIRDTRGSISSLGPLERLKPDVRKVKLELSLETYLMKDIARD